MTRKIGNGNTTEHDYQTAGKMPVFSIKNVRLFILFRLFFNSRFYYPVFTILFLDFGLSVSQFALLNAIWAATIVVMEVPSGALADTVGRRKLLIASGVLMVAEMLLLCFAPRGNADLVFALFMMNRILSGIAEASASGADEALAFDTLKKKGNAGEWGKVLEMQMRVQSVGFIAAMSIGAAVYDPALMQALFHWLGSDLQMSRDVTLRLPLFLSLVMAFLTLVTALKMREPDSLNSSENPETATTREAFALTLQAGGWILRTPFAVAIILAGLTFDGIARMVVTLSSQYYRLIQLPEALFGIIGSAVAILGFFVPRIARWMVERRTPVFNLTALAAMTFTGLLGMNHFVPYYGLAPALILFCTLYFTGFFVSHYLNTITASHRRATVLSFKGLCFNLFYGMVGILYSLLLARIRPGIAARHPGIAGEALENITFIESFNWFPWTFFVLLTMIVLISAFRLKRSQRYKQIH